MLREAAAAGGSTGAGVEGGDMHQEAELGAAPGVGKQNRGQLRR
jgi:hypothetical protein